MMRRLLLTALLVIAGSLVEAYGQDDTRGGRFVRTVWAPMKGNRFRVNSPDVSTKRFRDRWEAKQTGKLTLRIDEDPSVVTAAELYLEMWGGHPGVADKRFTLNDASVYDIPKNGAEEHNCTYSYPAVALKLRELRRGDNVFQFTCDGDKTFWGHYLLRQAAVRMTLKRTHGALKKAGLSRFAAGVFANPGKKEKIDLRLSTTARLEGRIASVEYWGRYVGYDENGNRKKDDWHGFTKDRKPTGIIGVAKAAPFSLTWDTSMLVDQKEFTVRAVVHFKDLSDVTYVTPVTPTRLPRRRARVSLHYAKDLPRPFWSRANRKKTCTIELPYEPADVERAELHVVFWGGHKGKTKDPFTLNGTPLPLADKLWGNKQYRVAPLELKILRKGTNKISLVCDTEHHGIELLLPGPALLVRTVEKTQ